jgi:hypothetical protein
MELCSFRQTPIISSLLGPNNLLKCLKSTFFLNVRDQVHTHTKLLVKYFNPYTFKLTQILGISDCLVLIKVTKRFGNCPHHQV